MKKILPVGLVAAALLGYWILGFPHKTSPVTFGITWSDIYARQLGLDARAAYKDALTDLGVRSIRLPVYWNEVEPRDGLFRFERVQDQLDQLQQVGGKAVVVVGIRQPRWPECWIPDWAKTLPVEKREEEQLMYVKKTVEQFRSHPALEAWQVENEFTLGQVFGECPVLPESLLEQEIALVRRTDSKHPLYTTVSGELSLWSSPAFRQVDKIGFSVYRTVVAPTGNRWSYWFVPPWMYARKAHLTQGANRMYVSEFQLEPWVQSPIQTVPVEEQKALLSMSEVNESVWYSKRMGFGKVYFWGAEWWYWMKIKMNQPEYWERMKSLFQSGR